MAEISRILTAAGLVVGSTGLIIYGIGAAFVATAPAIPIVAAVGAVFAHVG
jgi:hypothetical protein